MTETLIVAMLMKRVMMAKWRHMRIQIHTLMIVVKVTCRTTAVNRVKGVGTAKCEMA